MVVAKPTSPIGGTVVVAEADRIWVGDCGFCNCGAFSTRQMIPFCDGGPYQCQKCADDERIERAERRRQMQAKHEAELALKCSCSAPKDPADQHCASCERQALDRWIVASYRPKHVVVMDEGEFDPDEWTADPCTAVIVIAPKPEGMRESTYRRIRALAHVAAGEARRHLAAGRPVENALEHIALGSPTMQSKLEELYGISADEHTIRTDLEWLFGARVGELYDWREVGPDFKEIEGGRTWWIDQRERDPKRTWKSGTFLYRLNVVRSKLGELAASLVRDGVAASSSTVVVGITSQNWLQNCVKGAIQHARAGNRWCGTRFVVYRCIQAGLTEDQSERWLRAYWEGVPQPKGNPYTWREATRMLAGIFRYEHRKTRTGA